MKTKSVMTLICAIYSMHIQGVQITINNHNHVHASHTIMPAPIENEPLQTPSWWQRMSLDRTLLYQTVTGAMIVTAGYKLWQIKQSYDCLHNAHSWCAWHAEIPLAALQQLPHAQLVQEFTSAVQQQYADHQDALYCCVVDLTREHACIAHGLWLLHLLEYLPGVHAIWDITHMIEDHTQALKRIEFLKTLLRTEVLHEARTGSSAGM